MPTPAEQAEALALIAQTERARRKAQLQAEMDAGNAEHAQRLAAGFYRGALPGPESAQDAQVAPGPSATTPPALAAPGGTQIAPWARDALDYLGETAGNVPADAARVGEGIWQGVQAAADDPLAALQGIGESALGTMQTATRGPQADIDPRWDFRTASGADHYGRYDLHNIGESFRTTPVQTALDLGGVAAIPFAPVGAARLPGMVRGRRGPATERPPIMSPEDVKVATDAGNAVRETVGNVKGAAAEAARRERGTRAFIENAPTTEALHRQADVFFEAARKSGVRFSAREFGPFRKKLVRKLREEGADKVLHPKIARLVGLIEDAPPGVAPDMGNLMILRRQFGAAASDMDKSTARLGAIGVDLIDDFVESGSGSASGMMKDANRLWSQMRKSELIDRAIAKADTAQQGLEAGLRAEFKSIYRGIVDGNRKYRGFTPDETKAIKAVAQGNITGNVLRRIASLSGGSGPQRSMQNLIQGGAVGGGLGFALGGPAGAALGAGVAPLAGQVAGRLATRGTQRRADMARAIAARGQTPKQARKAPQDSTLTELMAGYMEASP